jgi:hypothetical protein
MKLMVIAAGFGQALPLAEKSTNRDSSDSSARQVEVRHRRDARTSATLVVKHRGNFMSGLARLLGRGTTSLAGVNDEMKTDVASRTAPS